MPRIIARAVIITGRSRVLPARSAASRGDEPSAILSLAKVTIRMLFAVATPTVIIAPISAGTERRGPGGESNPATPPRAPGRAGRTVKRTRHDPEVTTSTRYTSNTAEKRRTSTPPYD